MKKRNRILNFLLILFCLLDIGVVVDEKFLSENIGCLDDLFHCYPISNGMQISDPLCIIGNVNFLSVALSQGWTGDGSENNPLIIQNLTINTAKQGEHAIYIRNTSLYFNLRNCIVTATGEMVNGITPSGIYFSQVQNGILQNITAENCKGHGFRLDNCSNIVFNSCSAQNNLNFGFSIGNPTNQTCYSNFFLNNYARNNSYYAFYLGGSLNNTIIGNNAVDNQYGFYLKNCSENLIESNTAKENYYGFRFESSNTNNISKNIAYRNENKGFALFSKSNYNYFSENTVISSGDGFYLDESHNNTLLSNIVQSNAYGIYVGDSSNNTFSNNTLQVNSNYGICISGDYSPSRSENNTAFYNDFLANKNGYKQAYSGGLTNVFDYNYWSDYLLPDENHDNIVDIPYQLSPTVSDYYPTMQQYRYVSPSLPLSPKCVTNFNKLNITWQVPRNDGGLTILQYNVYRSVERDTGYIKIGTITDPCYIDTTLESGVKYYYVITAENAVGESYYSEETNGIAESIKDYRDIIILGIFGLIGLITIIVKETRKSNRLPPEKIQQTGKFCINCKILIPSQAQYCHICGCQQPPH